MKHFLLKLIAATIAVSSTASHAGLCGAGSLKGLAEGYNGTNSTMIYLNSNTPGLYFEGPYYLMTLQYNGVSATKFDALSKALRGAYFSGTGVRIYSSNGDCNNINEVRICTVVTDCM